MNLHPGKLRLPPRHRRPKAADFCNRLLTFLVLGVLTCHAQNTIGKTPAGGVARNRCDAADAAALNKVAEHWKEGYNTGNPSQVAGLYDEDAYYLTQHFAGGVIHGRDRIRTYVQRGTDAGYRVDSIDLLSMDCSGDLAYTVGRYESTNAGTKALGVNVVVLRKTAGKWLIVAHEAAVPEPAAVSDLHKP